MNLSTSTEINFEYLDFIKFTSIKLEYAVSLELATFRAFNFSWWINITLHFNCYITIRICLNWKCCTLSIGFSDWITTLVNIFFDITKKIWNQTMELFVKLQWIRKTQRIKTTYLNNFLYLWFLFSICLIYIKLDVLMTEDMRFLTMLIYEFSSQNVIYKIY